MLNQGEVYIPVQAQASNTMLMNVLGSGDEGTWPGFIVVHWVIPSGISGQFGFNTVGITVTPTTTRDEINQAISNHAFKDFSVVNLWRDAGCVIQTGGL